MIFSGDGSDVTDAIPLNGSKAPRKVVHAVTGAIGEGKARLLNDPDPRHDVFDQPAFASPDRHEA